AQGAASVNGMSNNSSLAALDQVLSDWSQTESGASNGTTHWALGQGSKVAVRPLLAPKATPASRLIIGAPSAEILLERGAFDRSLLVDSTLRIRKSLLGSLSG